MKKRLQMGLKKTMGSMGKRIGNKRLQQRIGKSQGSQQTSESICSFFMQGKCQKVSSCVTFIFTVNIKGKPGKVKSEETSRGKAHTNTQKLIWYISSITDVAILPPWWHFSKTLMSCHLYRVFTYIYCLLIEEDM